MRALGLALLFLAAAAPVRALDVHVAPGSTGDGTEDAPFGTVADALAATGPGDTVWLHDGEYGDVRVSGEGVVVAAATGQTPRLRTLTLASATDVVVRGLSISLAHAAPYETATMVAVERSSRGVTVEDCDIFSTTDDVVAGWSAEEWAGLPGTGMSSRAPETTFRNNRVRNVGYGISIAHDSPDARVIGNLVDHFSRDGLRGIGDFGLFEGNVVKNAYDVDDHHDDFFQSWSVGEDGAPGTGVVRGVVLRGNLFIGFEDPDRPFVGAAQGIGCFDGFFEDWVVENNVVIVNHWHGITFLGARNLRITNNTLLDVRRGERPGPPWIDVGPHKDGTPSSGVVVRNNLAETITVEADGAEEDHNLRYEDPSALFVDPARFDLRLLAGSAAVDTGSSDGAPSIDFDGLPRPWGDAIDVGAFEWHDGSATPVDAGTTEDGGRVEDAGAAADGGMRADGGGGESAGDGCGCTTGGAPSGAAFLGLALLWLHRRNRRRRFQL